MSIRLSGRLKSSVTYIDPFQACQHVNEKQTSQFVISMPARMVPSTLNAVESSSLPNWIVDVVQTPMGNVVAHQDMLKGILD